jgi:hypothetical protein
VDNGWDICDAESKRLALHNAASGLLDDLQTHRADTVCALLGDGVVVQYSTI